MIDFTKTIEVPGWQWLLTNALGLVMGIIVTVVCILMMGKR